MDADLIAHARACHDRFLAKADEQGPMGQGKGLLNPIIKWTQLEAVGGGVMYVGISVDGDDWSHHRLCPRRLVVPCTRTPPSHPPPFPLLQVA